MATKDESNRLPRKKALSMDEMIKMYIDDMKIAAGLNTQRIFVAWDEVSGVEKYTLKKFFRDGVLYVTLSSSAIRNQIYFQRDALIKKMNEKIMEDPLFTKNDPKVGLVEKLVLK